MNHVDYYKILNVSKTATIEQIKVSYRKLAKTYHPDLCTTDKKAAESTFKNLSVAYQVLSNSVSKSEYDRTIGNYPGRLNNESPRRAWTTGRNNIRSPAKGTTSQVTRDQYDVHMWNAYHYGEEDNPTIKQAPIMNQRGWVDPTNKHQSYYRKKYARDWEERNSGVKWSADTAYRSSNTDFSSSSSRAEPKRTYERASSADFNKVEQQRQSATDNLRKSRAERVQRSSNGEPTAKQPSSCVIF